LKAKIYINGELCGYCENPLEFTNEIREKRRTGKLSDQMNITYYEENNEIYIFTDPGRARRPLIIVEEGVPLLREEHLNKIAHGRLRWDDLIKMGIVEFLDAEEEENSYIAISLADLNDEHTHLEIDPATILGICAGLIPFSDHNSSPRNTMEAGMSKQALGLYASNYAMRTDTIAHILHNPQKPIVKTRLMDSTNYDLRPSGQNFVVALMSYEGYNMEDAMVISKASLERGLARSSFFRAYDTSEKRYYGGAVDKFEVPDITIKGYRSEKAYRNLDEDGIVNPESYVESGDVLIGKTSPPRFLQEDFFGVQDRRRETSVTVRHGEKGIVDAVLLSETIEGSRLAKVRLRDTRQPEYGDKFASRHGQKGVIGLILPPEDMPFTEFGVVPDLIVNPHSIPSRMSVGLVLEMVAGKAGCLEGERVDATPFNQTVEDEIKQQLIGNGYEFAGCESLYDAVTGERFEAEIFVGVMYYQKLHHMTTDKVYARARGPVQVLTRQPTEGRAREGGLRFGEMERDCLIAHGAALTLKERLLDESDKYEAIVCVNCGMLAVFDRSTGRKYCPVCGDVDTYPVEISFAFKLLLDELKSLCIFPKLILSDKIDSKKPFKKKHSFKVKPLEENRNFISKSRLADEEPLNLDFKADDSLEDNTNVVLKTSLNDEKPRDSDSKLSVSEKSDVCIICGKKLTKNQDKLCRSCARKQYASRIIKKLSGVVKPGVPFKKSDLNSLNLLGLQIKDYIWTLQEFNLIDVDGTRFVLKDGETLNDFRIQSHFEPIDFDNIENLDKTCKICGKTLPLSKFYKSSEEYGDYCKDCHKLTRTASYLYEIIEYFGYGSKFNENDLNKYISNRNQLMGVIWALQENDLLIEVSPSTFVLADEYECLKFLNKYYVSSESKIFDVGGSKSQSDDISVTEEDKPVSQPEKTKLPINKQEQMQMILKLRKSGKSREEAAKIVDIPLYRINHWYKEGRQGFGKDNVEFYKKLKKIENKLLSLTDSNERKQMDFVLKLMRQGKSKDEIAKFIELDKSTLTFWYNQGKEKTNKNTIYFYREVQKINKGRIKKKKTSSKLNKQNIVKSSSKRTVEKKNNNNDSQLKNMADERKLINQNAIRIINLRKKYNDLEDSKKISEISMRNNKLNAKLKSGKSVVYNEILDVKKSLDDFESHLNNSTSFKLNKETGNNKSNMNKTNNEHKNIESMKLNAKSKEDNNSQGGMLSKLKKLFS